MAVIPHPNELWEIQLTLQSSKQQHHEYFRYDDRDTLAKKVNEVLYSNGLDKPIKVRNLGRQYTHLLNAYSLTRAMIQTNEACNKVWATVELLHALSYWNKGEIPDFIFPQKPTTEKTLHRPMCTTFNVEFSGGTIIPTLYYAQLSAVISLMSSFGCVSISDSNSLNFYNLVRTKNQWKIFYRRKFIHDLCGEKAKRSWHDQLIQILCGLSNKLEHFPPVDVDLIQELANARNQRHYEILGSLDAKYSRGIDEYLEYLPRVMETIDVALFIIKMIHREDGLAGFARFKELYTNVTNLYLEYAKDPPELFSPSI